MTDPANIISLAQALVLARLQDRAEVLVPCIGLFRSKWHEEYIVNSDGVRTLMPPRVSLEYLPAEYVLTTQRYTRLDFDTPESYFDTEFVSNLSLLHNLNEVEVTTTLQQYCEEVLCGLFRGRRVSFMDMGDLFVSEEEIGILLLNFVPNPDFQAKLNQVFSVYKPTTLPDKITFADLQELDKEEDPAPLRQYVISSTTPKVEETPKQEITSPPQEEPIKAPEPLQKRRRSNWWWQVAGLLVLVGVAAWVWWRDRPNEKEPTPEVAEVIEPTPIDTVVIESPTPVLHIDTIRVARGGSLAEIARQYYHDVYKWVYIYMANKDSIPNPNILVYGQELVVPNLDHYHLRSDSIEALQEAKAWATLIMNKQFHSYEEQRQNLVIP